MKKIFLAFLAVAAFGCSSDNNDDVNEDAFTGDQRLIGTWQVERRWLYGDEYPLTECGGEDKFVFNKNGNYILNEFWNNIGVGCVDEGSAGTFSLFSSALTLDFQGGSRVVTIVNLTDTKLKVNFGDSDIKQYKKID